MTPELKISITSLVVSFCAMATGVIQSVIQRRHHNLMVRPYLDQLRIKNGHTPYYWEIVNCGLGPAIITNFVVVIGTKVLKFPEIDQIESELRTIGIPLKNGIGNLSKNSIIRTGENIRLLEFDQEEILPYSGILNHIRWEIGYSCAYGTKFTLVFPASSPP
ncbi:MAG: hypothetical protein HY823_00240 [Acidobacteria bacterium]|nr:hypothetical protein [Acidobacteriota bacterium]